MMNISSAKSTRAKTPTISKIAVESPDHTIFKNILFIFIYIEKKKFDSSKKLFDIDVGMASLSSNNGFWIKMHEILSFQGRIFSVFFFHSSLLFFVYKYSDNETMPHDWSIKVSHRNFM